MADLALLLAALAVLWIVLALLGVVADSAERRDARRRNGR